MVCIISLRKKVHHENTSKNKEKYSENVTEYDDSMSIELKDEK